MVHALRSFHQTRLTTILSGQGLGSEGFEHFFQAFRTAFPDRQVMSEQVITDEDSVALASPISVGRKACSWAFLLQNSLVTVRGVQVSPFAKSTFVERWGSSNQLSM
jgi:hypothetical protein